MKVKQFDAASTQRLYTALDNNDVREFQAMHDAGYPVATHSFGGAEWEKTSLMMLVDKPNVQLASVKKLIELGSRLDAVDSYKSTPLHIAASNPDNNPQTQAAIIVYLVRKGATLEGNAHLDMLDNGDDRPIDCARQNENESVRELFKESFFRATAYANSMRNMLKTTQAPSEQRRLFNDGMESDEIYDDMMREYDQNDQVQKSAEKTGGGFADKESQRRAGQQQTSNPMLTSLVANEGGGHAEKVRLQREEKKKESCCVVM